MKVLMLAATFDGLVQRAWVELRRGGHQVTVELVPDVPAVGPDAIRTAARLAGPDLVLCAPGTARVPDDVRTAFRTVVVSPGALRQAVLTCARRAEVTATQLLPDGERIWATQEFDIPGPVVAVSALAAGPLADAATDVIHEVVGRAVDPRFTGVPRPGGPPGAEPDVRIDWERDSRDEVFRKVAASDGSPGAPCDVTALGVLAMGAGGRGTANVEDTDLLAYDAFPAEGGGPPGLIGFHRDGAALIGCADGAALWIGHLRRPGGVKLPAARVLGRHARDAARSPDQRLTTEREIRYHRQGPVGWLTFDLYNGAMSTAQCRRLLLAFHHAAAQDTRVLVLRGGDTFFAKGMHLGEVEAAARPPVEAWANVEAMDDLCRAVITCVHQLVVAGVSGNAGGGGLMLALGADVVAARAGIVLNPHHRTFGLYGSEYWTYTLPRRVGQETAAELTGACLPVGDEEALRLGLADEVLARDPARYDDELRDLAERLAADDWHRAVEDKIRRRTADEARLPLEVHRTRELHRTADDLFGDDVHARLRRAFVMKEPVTTTPARLALHRRVHGWFPTPRVADVSERTAWERGERDGDRTHAAGAAADGPVAGPRG